MTIFKIYKKKIEYFENNEENLCEFLMRGQKWCYQENHKNCIKILQQE